jgi:hypothetical protein
MTATHRIDDFPGSPAHYEINFEDCTTPWFIVPASTLPVWQQANLKGFEYRALYRGDITSASASPTPLQEAKHREKVELLALVDRLLGLAKDATPGPWAVHSREMDDNEVTEVSFICEEGGSYEDIFVETLGGNHDDAANAAYIVAADPDNVARICRALKRHLGA